MKNTIFATIEGANDRRFISFNDMPLCSSKYQREQVGIVDFSIVEGREKPSTLNPQPIAISPSYNANVLYFKQNLRKGAIEFDQMSARKPNMNKTYGSEHQFYTQAKNMTTVEHRPRIERKLIEDPSGLIDEMILGSTLSAENTLLLPDKSFESKTTLKKSPKFRSMNDHL